MLELVRNLVCPDFWRGIFMLQTGVKCGKIPISVEEWADVLGKCRKNGI